MDLGVQGATGAQWRCAHAPVCGRWEGVGGWELISWNLVSAQSLGTRRVWQPHLHPHQHPISLWLPICPRTPSCPPGMARQSYSESSNTVSWVGWR